MTTRVRQPKKGPKPAKKVTPGSEAGERYNCEKCSPPRQFSRNGLKIHLARVHGEYVERKPRKRVVSKPSIAQAKRDILIARVAAGEKYLDVARELGVAPATAYGWTERAIDAGELSPPEEGLVPKARISKQRRVALLKLLEDPDMTVKEAAIILRIGESTAHSWLLQHRREEAERTLEAQVELEANPDPIPYEELDDEARAILDDFGRFRVEILGMAHNPPWAEQTAEMLLDLYLSEEDEYAVVNAPPGVGKSTLITHDFVVWFITRERALGREPTIVLGHRAKNRSFEYVSRVRETLEFNEKLIRTYGRFKYKTLRRHWSQERIEIELLDGVKHREKEPTITAASYEAALLSGRYKLNIWDDLLDESNCTTLEQREKLEDWWEQVAETRMNVGGLTILSNARFGPEDLSWKVRQVLDDEDVDEIGTPRPIYHHLAFRAHAVEKCEAPAGGEHHGDWPNGCLLDSLQLSWRRMRKARQNELRFELIYQQADVDPRGSLAQRAWFEGGKNPETGEVSAPIFHEELSFGRLPEGRLGGPDHPLISAVTIDPGSARNWAVGHFVSWADRIHLLYRCKRGPMQAPEILYSPGRGEYIGLLEDWWRASNDEGVPFTYLIVESNNAQRWLMQYPFFTEWCMVRGVTLIQHGTTAKNKPDPERGVEMLKPIYRHAQLWLPYMGHEERIIADQFRREACAWPEGATDDLVMMHWFFTHRLDALMVGELAEAAEDPDEDPSVPGFVRHREMPAWAGKRTRSLTSSGQMAS